MPKLNCIFGRTIIFGGTTIFGGMTIVSEDLQYSLQSGVVDEEESSVIGRGHGA